MIAGTARVIAVATSYGTAPFVGLVLLASGSTSALCCLAAFVGEVDGFCVVPLPKTLLLYLIATRSGCARRM